MKKLIMIACMLVGIASGVSAQTNIVCGDISLIGKPIDNIIQYQYVYSHSFSPKEVDTPIHTTVITKSDIKKLHYTDTAELLSMFTHIGNLGPIPSISMRGFGENSFGRVAVVVDGIRINNPDMEPPDLGRIPLSSIERVEIMRGPQSVMFGDFSSGGVISITTSPDSFEPKTTVGANVGSDDTYGGFISKVGSIDGNSVFYSSNVDYEKSNTSRDHSGKSTVNVSGAVKKILNKDNDYVLASAHYEHFDYDLTGSLSEEFYDNEPFASTTPLDESDGTSYGVSIIGRNTVSETAVVQYAIFSTFRDRDAEWHSSFGDSFGDYESKSYGASLEYNDFRDFLGKANSFNLGADVTFDDYTSIMDTGMYSTHSSYKRIGLGTHVLDEIYLADKVSLTAGYRFNNYDSEWSGGFDDDWNWNEHAYEVGLNYNPNKMSKLFVRGTSFFRAPFCDEMNYVKAGEKLDTETGYSADVGGSVILSKNTKISVSAYYMTISDEIFFDPHYDAYFGGYNANYDGDTTRIGADVEIRTRLFDKLTGIATYNFVDSSFSSGKYDGNDIPLVPSHAASLYAIYDVNEMFSVFSAVRYTSTQRFGSDFENVSGKIDDFVVADVGVRCNVDTIIGKLELELAVNNVFDKKYSDYAGYNDYSGKYYYTANDRAVSFRMKCEF